MKKQKRKTKWILSVNSLAAEMGDMEKKPKKKFSKKQLRASQGVLTMQAKTNIYANQSGMRGFGAVRHVSDIRSDDANQEGQGILTQQAQTNIYASQKGARCFGAVRHVSDIRADDASLEGLSTLSLQTGTNQFASQKGMTSFGAVRHVSDIKVKELYDEGDDDEYPTDEDDPTPVCKPTRKIRDEVPTEQPCMQEPSPEPKVMNHVEPEPEVEQNSFEPETTVEEQREEQTENEQDSNTFEFQEEEY